MIKTILYSAVALCAVCGVTAIVDAQSVSGTGASTMPGNQGTPGSTSPGSEGTQSGTMPGSQMPGNQSMPGQPMPRQPMPGQPMPAQSMPSDPMPGQSMPGSNNAQGTASGAVPPAPTEAMNKTYPPCTAQLQDNCMNNRHARMPGHRMHRPM